MFILPLVLTVHAAASNGYLKESSLSFGAKDEHKMQCKYEISPDGTFNMANTGCSFDMAGAGHGDGPNPCEGKKRRDSFPGDGYFNNVECIAPLGAMQTLEQSPANVTLGYRGELDTADRRPISRDFISEGLCKVGVLMFLGAEHLSAGEYDAHGKGPDQLHHDQLHRILGRQGGMGMGFKCHMYDAADAKFTTPYNWQYCQNVVVGGTYEVQWVHSAAGACGTAWQYQSNFYDGIFCVDGILSVAPLNFHQKIGFQAQVFTIVNDEQFYRPDLFSGMIAYEGMSVAKYTGSTSGASRSNTVCSRYTPISWHVDRKCHLISASSFDDMCQTIMAQADWKSWSIYPNEARELVADHLAANNQV
mmetsp:Transcript_69935/g.138602  ORF Transcript_69935/g.138602 Transcript_69935/m.138602 type:complete len:362 (-) Transcript_69935:237-1322(-)|eukprot:CAMPEP_0174708628 /NCGR_PEP_ID=MMETSP1094-20130205/10822_1 /TAXON_ID=156173 /ORGANISM="Chrysochromulina brevifilum, Strain UTEX LB 985" /LENGTH=361 /DNA_ID=CAMNT_0015907209 /DNA_START=93 /DNA_END=1178 /DNA_ORIENTATION=+